MACELQTTQDIVGHVRNGSYGTSGNDQRQEREGDEQGVWHRTLCVAQGAKGTERRYNKVRYQPTKKKEPTADRITFSSTPTLGHATDACLNTTSITQLIIHAILACGPP